MDREFQTKQLSNCRYRLHLKSVYFPPKRDLCSWRDRLSFLPTKLCSRAKNFTSYTGLPKGIRYVAWQTVSERKTETIFRNGILALSLRPATYLSQHIRCHLTAKSFKIYVMSVVHCLHAKQKIGIG